MQQETISIFKERFEDVKTVEDVKILYRQFAKQEHPDVTGKDGETFKQLNKEYLKRLSELDGTQFRDSINKYKFNEEFEQELINKINEIFRRTKAKDINCYIVGLWVWVDGNTYPNRKVIQNIGFKWSNTRKKYYFGLTTSRYHKGSFDAIAAKYGITEIKNSNEDIKVLAVA